MEEKTQIEDETALQFRTVIPNLKLLPVHYENNAPPEEPEPARVVGKADPRLLNRDAIIFKTENDKKRLRGGTIYSFITYFLQDKEADKTDLLKFLICYRKYCSPEDLWRVVTKRFFPDDQEEMNKDLLSDQRSSVIDFLLFWLDKCAAQDFFSSREKFANPLWRALHVFIMQIRVHGFISDSDKLVAKIKEKSGLGQSNNATVAEGDYRGVVWGITQTLFPRSLVPGEFEFLDLHTQEVAHCLTLTESNLFKNIRTKEFIEKTWIKDESRSLIYVMVNRFNHVAFWVATQIVSTTSLSQRKIFLERFITIADSCYQLCNFNSAMEVLAGLSMGPVSRLKKTWATLPTTSLESFKQLEECMKPLRNYQDYRAKLLENKLRGVPLLPYLGLYLKDLTFIDENNDHLEDGLINFEKIDLLGGVIAEIEYFQHKTFKLQEVEEPIVNYLNNLQVMNEDELYALSQKHEPRGS